MTPARPRNPGFGTGQRQTPRPIVFRGIRRALKRYFTRVCAKVRGFVGKWQLFPQTKSALSPFCVPKVLADCPSSFVLDDSTQSIDSAGKRRDPSS